MIELTHFKKRLSKLISLLKVSLATSRIIRKIHLCTEILRTRYFTSTFLFDVEIKLIRTLEDNDT